MNTSIKVEGFQEITLIGQYEFVHFTEEELVIQQESYVLHCEAEDLLIETLSEEQLVFTCSTLIKLFITHKDEWKNEA